MSQLPLQREFKTADLALLISSFKAFDPNLRALLWRARVGFFGNLIEGVGIAQHKSAVRGFLKQVLALEIPAAQFGDFGPLIATEYSAGSSIENIGLKIATAYYAKVCTGNKAERHEAAHLYMKLPFVINTSAATGAITVSEAEEFSTVIRTYTQQRLLREE